MRAKIVELPTHTSSPPHCCVVTGRTDRPVIDFGDLHIKAQGPGDPRVYIRDSKVEFVARELLGMVSGKKLEGALARIAELKAEIEPLRERSDVEERLRQALGPAPIEEKAK